MTPVLWLSNPTCEASGTAVRLVTRCFRNTPSPVFCRFAEPAVGAGGLLKEGKMAPSFHPLFKTYRMPNSANRNHGGNNASKGQPKHEPGRGSDQKPNPERSDIKHNTDGDGKGSTGRTSNQGRKSASGGEAEE